jgi:Fur family ferric uptake transcriptional regulator
VTTTPSSVGASTPAETGRSPGPARPERRPTRQRAALATALADSTEFLSAQEIHARLSAAGTRVGLATVYRNLQAMVAEGELDVLRTDDGEAAYRACSTGHHHHLVCRSCGRTVEVEGPAVERWAAAVSAEHGFTDVTHTLEIFGTCATCST